MKSLKRVPSFQTSDGLLFEDKIKALSHEGELSLIEFITKNSPTASRNIEQLTPKSIAYLIIKHQEEVAKILQDYRTRLAANKREKEKKVEIGSFDYNPEGQAVS
jgi:hypothetical protein